MKKICIVGPIDKRVVVYPLIKVADLVGKLLVVTDDANFRRFGDDFEKEFNRGNSDFLILNDIDDDEILENKGFRVANYDFIIYITTKSLIKDCDKYVYCHGMSKTVLPEKTLFELDKVEHTEVYITQSVLKEKGIIKVGVDKVTMGYVWGCEESRSFVPLKDSNMAKISSFLFADYIGVSQDEYKKLLLREEC